MIRPPGNQKSSNRLEFHYYTYQKVLMGIVAPIILGALGAFLLSIVIQDPSSFNIGVGFFWFLFFFWSLVRIPKIFSGPPIVFDEEGITDNLNLRTVKIPWEDIGLISFPYRYVYKHHGQHVLSIQLENPRKYHHRIPLTYKVIKLFRPYAGDYEISFYQVSEYVHEVRRHLRNLKAKGHLPPTLTISEIKPQSFPY